MGEGKVIWQQIKQWFAKVIACFVNTFDGQSMQRQVPWLLIDHEWAPQWEAISSRLQRSVKQPARPGTNLLLILYNVHQKRMCYWFIVKLFFYQLPQHRDGQYCFLCCVCVIMTTCGPGDTYCSGNYHRGSFEFFIRCLYVYLFVCLNSFVNAIVIHELQSKRQPGNFTGV